jgi:hypothetical protein
MLKIILTKHKKISIMFHQFENEFKNSKKLATVLAQCTINQSSYTVYIELLWLFVHSLCCRIASTQNEITVWRWVFV